MTALDAEALAVVLCVACGSVSITCSFAPVYVSGPRFHLGCPSTQVRTKYAMR
jgi:hypothetical protein